MCPHYNGNVKLVWSICFSKKPHSRKMSSTKQDLFLLLPSELIEIIVDNLDFTDGLNLSHCNRRLYEIIGQHNNYWQKHIDEVAQFSRRDVVHILPERSPDISTKEEFLLHRRLRQCWRTGDFSVKQHLITNPKYVHFYSNFYLSAAFCRSSGICELVWCSQVTGLVTRSLELDHENLYAIKDICAVSQRSVVVYFVDENIANEEYDKGRITLICVGLMLDEVTLKWTNSFPSNISSCGFQLAPCRGKLYLLVYSDTYGSIEAVSIETGERNEIVRIPKLPFGHLEFCRTSNIVECENEPQDRLTKWLILDHSTLEYDPDREAYLINTETNQVEHVIKLTQFKESNLIFFGNNLLSLPFASSEGTKAQVYQLPELVLLYEFPWEKSWGYPEFDCNKIHYFYDEDSEILHRFTKRGKAHLEMAFKDFASNRCRQLVEDTMFDEYPDIAPGQLSFFQLPLKPGPDHITYSIPILENIGPNKKANYWSVESLSTSIIIDINVSILDEAGIDTDEYETHVFWLKPNIY